jgi:hypothetical protein
MKTIDWCERYGFDSRIGEKDGCVFMNKHEHIEGFMTFYERNKIKAGKQ